MQRDATKIKHPLPRALRRGFALPVVLAGLLIVTALFATAQTRSLSHLGQLEAERRLLVRAADRQAALDFALVQLQAFPETRQASFPLQPQRRLIFQDVGGLIDVNTAHPDLLDRLARTLDVPASGVAQLRDWRRGGLRLLDLKDFARLTGLSWQDAERLPFLATVASGRFGIDPDTAPSAVLDIAGAGSGLLPDEFIDQPTASVFSVWEVTDKPTPPIYLGTVQLFPEKIGRILDING